jgi:DNA-binding MarR family transcriptional regulator
MTAMREDSGAALARAGINRAAIAAVLEVDAMMQHWRRRVMKRELGHRALADLGIPLDLAQLDVLTAIDPMPGMFDDGASETTVGVVAERLSIDPSRASRLVTEMVEAGYVARGVSQQDARRVVMVLTPAGEAIVNAVRSYKSLVMGSFFDSWTEDELKAFLPLLKRFSAWTDQSGASEFRAEIEALAATVKDAGPAEVVG